MEYTAGKIQFSAIMSPKISISSQCLLVKPKAPLCQNPTHVVWMYFQNMCVFSFFVCSLLNLKVLLEFRNILLIPQFQMSRYLPFMYSYRHFLIFMCIVLPINSFLYSLLLSVLFFTYSWSARTKCVIFPCLNDRSLLTCNIFDNG